MIRLVHFADIHIGAEAYGRVDPQTGVSSRLTDFLRALDQMVDYALAHDVGLLVFAGDAYKSREPSPTHQREFASRILRVARSGIPVVLLAGNHDMPQVPARATSVDIFATLQVEGVHVARTIDTLALQTKQGPIQVVTVPWITRTTLLTQDECRGKTMQQIDLELLGRVEELLREETRRLDSSLPTVLAVHGSVTGATFGSEKSVMLGAGLTLPLGLVSDPAFDYVALGHIHKHQVLRRQPPVVYSGSMERIDFSEESEDKGFVVVEVERGQCSFAFVPVSARRFITIQARPTGDDPTAEVLEIIARQEIAEAVVRLIIRVSEAQAPLLNLRTVRKALDPAFHVASVALDVARESRIRIGSQAVEGLTPIEMLVRYLETKNTGGERAQRLTSRASKLMQDLND